MLAVLAVAVAIAFLRACSVDNETHLLEAFVGIEVVEEFDVAQRSVVGAAHVNCGVGDALERE